MNVPPLNELLSEEQHIVMYNLAVLASFTKFLLIQINRINPEVVCFLFDPIHGEAVDYIAQSLQGHRFYFLNNSRLFGTQINNNALLLSFRNVCHDNVWTKFSTTVQTIVVNLEGSIGPKDGDESIRLVFADRNEDRTWPCIECRWLDPDGTGIVEKVFLKSFAWSEFLGQVRRLPDNANHLTFIDDCMTDRAGMYVKKINSPLCLVTGYRTGIYKLIFKQLNARYSYYLYLDQFNFAKF